MADQKCKSGTKQEDETAVLAQGPTPSEPALQGNVPPQNEESTRETIQSLRARRKMLAESAAFLQKERDLLKQKVKELTTDINRKQFTLSRFKYNDEDIEFYTGFPTHTVLQLCLEMLNPGEHGENIIYAPTTDPANSGTMWKKRKLKIEDEFFIVLIVMRLALPERHLAHIFNTSEAIITRIVFTWINYMYLRMGNLNMWPSDELISKTMPSSVKEKYPNLTWILDTVEIECEFPPDRLPESQCASETPNTVKGLIACIPSGQIGFISQLYTGNITDRDLVRRSGFLSMNHTPGKMWSVDEDILILDLADDLDVEVNMSVSSHQMAAGLHPTQQVSSERLLVEKVIDNVKKFHIFDLAIPSRLFGCMNQMWTVCAFLTLMQNPVLTEMIISNR